MPIIRKFLSRKFSSLKRNLIFLQIIVLNCKKSVIKTINNKIMRKRGRRARKFRMILSSRSKLRT
jgi:hypothetical protein